MHVHVYVAACSDTRLQCGKHYFEQTHSLPTVYTRKVEIVRWDNTGLDNQQKQPSCDILTTHTDRTMYDYMDKRMPMYMQAVWPRVDKPSGPMDTRSTLKH